MAQIGADFPALICANLRHLRFNNVQCVTKRPSQLSYSLNHEQICLRGVTGRRFI